MKTRILFILLLALHSFGYALQDIIPSDILKNKRILILFSSKSAAGPSVYKFNLYKHLRNAGYNVHMLIMRCNPYIEKKLSEYKLPYARLRKNIKQKPLEEQAFHIYKYCLQEKIDIIHVHTPRDVALARIVAQQLPIRIVVTLHTESGHQDLKSVDGIITVSPNAVRVFEELNRSEERGAKTVEWVAPFFDQEKFLRFTPEHFDRKSFFENVFSVDIADVPIICMVGKFYRNSAWKNHPLLLHAIKKLVFELQIPVQLVLAGDGPAMKKMQKLAQKLDIGRFVHFIGFTHRVPEVMYHADIVVLTSSEEAFGIVLAEAALLKKPLIGTRGTGMEAIIKHRETGLLFEKDNVDDLTQQIKYVLENRAQARLFGEHACTYVLNNFSTHACLAKLDEIYRKVLL